MTHAHARPPVARPELPREPVAPPGGMMHPGIARGVRTPPVIVWYMVKDVARLLDVSKMTVYRLIHTKELDATRVGRSFRVQEREVHRFIRENSTMND